MTREPEVSAGQIDWHTGVPLARGGSGEIVRAYSPDLGRDIAVKYLRQEGPGAIERMLREARTQRALSHPHILPIHATGVHLDRHYIAMDLVDGQPLDTFLLDRSIDEKLAVFDQVLDAMAYAHAQRVVHRDLKPANLMVERRDGHPHAWVMDFGLARRPDDTTLTMAGDALGTPGYMAPEQARGVEGADPRADIYALGVVLYQLLTGTLPYSADTPMALVMQAASGQLIPVSEIQRRLPDGLSRIIVRCLEANAQRRYPDAGALREDLAAFTAGRAVDAPALGRRYRLGRWARANPWRARLVLALATVVLLGGASLLVMADQNRRALTTASNLIADAERARADWYIDQLLPLHDQRGALQRARETVRELSAARNRLNETAAARIDAALSDLLDAIGEPSLAFERAALAWQGGLRNISVADRAARARLQQFGTRQLAIVLTTDAASQVSLLAAARAAMADDLTPYRALLASDMRHRIDQMLGTESGPDQRPPESTARALLGPDDWQIALLDLQAETAGLIDLLNIDPEQALPLLETVESRLEALQDTARSYRPAYALGCTIAAARQSLQTLQSEAAAVETSRLACEQGLQLAPDDAELLATSSTQLWLHAKNLMRDRLPFDAPLDRAISQARTALRVDPDNEQAQLALGSALHLLGRKHLAEGEDAEPALDESLRWLEQVHRARPNDTGVLNSLAATWSTIASARNGAGGTRAGLEADRETIRWLQAAAAVTPDDRRLVHNLLFTRGNVAYQDALLGSDPSTELASIIADLNTLAAAYPDYISPLNTLGINWWTFGLWQALSGEDPTAAFRAAQTAFERALERRPDWDTPRINHAGVARQWLALSTRPPGAELSALADDALATYRELESADRERLEFGCLAAEILTAQSRWTDPDQAQALLRDAEAQSRLDRNIHWVHNDCMTVRARIGRAWISRSLESRTVDSLWQETQSSVRGSDDALLLIAATLFAAAIGEEDLARQWAGRIPAPFRHRLDAH